MEPQTLPLFLISPHFSLPNFFLPFQIFLTFTGAFTNSYLLKEVCLRLSAILYHRLVFQKEICRRGLCLSFCLSNWEVFFAEKAQEYLSPPPPQACAAAMSGYHSSCKAASRCPTQKHFPFVFVSTSSQQFCDSGFEVGAQILQAC